MIRQKQIYQGRVLNLTWYEADFEPPPEQITQAYGICFTEQGRIVLVSVDGQYWNLPGGTVEAGETVTQTLAREVWEEACARVVASRYIGCQQVEDVDRPDDGPKLYYQTRFWARVTLDAFQPQFEIIARRLIAPARFRSTLTWGHVPIAGRILDLGLTTNNTYHSK